MESGGAPVAGRVMGVAGMPATSLSDPGGVPGYIAPAGLRP
jgi:hypothetical protein